MLITLTLLELYCYPEFPIKLHSLNCLFPRFKFICEAKNYASYAIYVSSFAKKNLAPRVSLILAYLAIQSSCPLLKHLDVLTF